MNSGSCSQISSSCNSHINQHYQSSSLQASSLGRSGAGAGKGRRVCNYVFGIWISASKKSMRNADWWRWRYPWHVFFNLCFHSCLFLLHADWQKSDSSVDREPWGNWRWNSNSNDIVASSPSFSCPAARAPQRASSQAIRARKKVPSSNPGQADFLAEQVTF